MSSLSPSCGITQVTTLGSKHLDPLEPSGKLCSPMLRQPSLFDCIWVCCLQAVCGCVSMWVLGIEPRPCGSLDASCTVTTQSVSSYSMCSLGSKAITVPQNPFLAFFLVFCFACSCVRSCWPQRDPMPAWCLGTALLCSALLCVAVTPITAFAKLLY